MPTKAVTELQRMLGDEGEIQIAVGENPVSFEQNDSQLVSSWLRATIPTIVKSSPERQRAHYHRA